MCRMYASLGGHGPPPGELLAFRAQCTASACGPHGDGWGVVGFAAPQSPRFLGRAPVRALDDKDFEEAAAQAGRCPVVLAHLRAASVGPKTLENTQPFVLGGWAF
ncbi:MAG: class II glutamine amidotransferase, partial [Halobacteriales archaeon]|nr:class II glutamine amidotransferase [Halobacteriales archaeon]